MTEPLYPSRKLSWEEVSRRIQDQLESLLGRPLSCRVFLEDLDYWGLANDTVFTQTEVERLLRAPGAGRDEWQENLYPDEEESKSLGMGLSRLLLQQALHGNWETEFCTAESLWLLNYHAVGTSRTLALRLPGVEVPLEELRPQEELFHYFEENKVVGLLRMLTGFGEIEIVFDTVSKSGMAMMRKKYMKQVGHRDAQMFFYVDSASELTGKIGSGVRVLAEEPYYRHIPRTGLKLSTKISMSVSDRFWMVKMVHLATE